MKKFNRFIQIIWLGVAAVAAWEAYLSYYNTKMFNGRFWLMIGAFTAAIAMYSIRKRQGRSMK